MTEATKRPWYASHDGNNYDHIQSAAVNEDNYVARVDSTDAQGNANADLIVKAVNSHDALVAALETALNTETAARIGAAWCNRSFSSESGAMQGFDYKYHYDKIRRALDQVK